LSKITPKNNLYNRFWFTDSWEQTPSRPTSNLLLKRETETIENKFKSRPIKFAAGGYHTWVIGTIDNVKNYKAFKDHWSKAYYWQSGETNSEDRVSILSKVWKSTDDNKLKLSSWPDLYVVDK